MQCNSPTYYACCSMMDKIWFLVQEQKEILNLKQDAKANSLIKIKSFSPKTSYHRKRHV